MTRQAACAHCCPGGSSRFRSLPYIFVGAAAFINILAAFLSDGALSLLPIVSLLLPCLLALCYLLLGLILRSKSVILKQRELGYLAYGFLLGALGIAGLLLTWMTHNAVFAWLGPIGQIGFALSVACYCLHDLQSPAAIMRYLAYSAWVMVLVFLVTAGLNWVSWPLNMLEVVAITGTLMLLLTCPHKQTLLDIWLTAAFALMLLERCLSYTAATPGTLAWLTGWSTSLIQALILLYVVLYMALQRSSSIRRHPR